MYELYPPRVGKLQQAIDQSVFTPVYLDNKDYLDQLASNVGELHSYGNKIAISAVSGEVMSVGPATTSNSYTNAGGYAYLLQPIVFPTYGAVYVEGRMPAGMTNINVTLSSVVYPTTAQAGNYPSVGFIVQVMADKQYYYYPYNLVPSDVWVDLGQYIFENLLFINFAGQYGMSPLHVTYTFDGLVPKERYRIIPYFGIATSAALPATGVYKISAEPSGTSPIGIDHEFIFTTRFGG